MREPLAAPSAAVAAGVFAARLASLSFLEAVVAGSLCAGLAVVGLRAERPYAGLAALLFGFSFVGAALLTSEPRAAPDRIDLVLAAEDISEPIRLTGWVSRPPEKLPDADRFTLEAETVLAGERVTGGVQVTVRRPPEDPALRLDYGDRLELLVRFRRPRNYGNPGAFDRVEYLRRQGVYLTATVRPYAPLLPLDGARGSGWESALWRARAAVKRRFERLRAAAGLDGSEAAAVLEASLLGDRGSLSRETESDFQRSGTYHSLVVSGLHVGLLAGAALWLLRFAGLGRGPAAMAAVGLAAAYALLLDTPLPAVRAAWMLAAYLAATVVYRARRALNVIAAVALGFLAVDPAAVFDPGFQLSFGAVAAIAAIGVPLLERWTVPRLQALGDLDNLDLDPHLTPEAAARRVALRNWLAPLALLTRTPAAVWIGGLRLVWTAASMFLVSTVLLAALAVPMAQHFQRVAGGSPLANLITLPLLTAAVPLGFAALVSGRPLLFQAAAWCAEGMAHTAAASAATLTLDRRVPPPPDWLAWLAVASLVVWAVTLRRGGSRRGGAASRAAAVAAMSCFALVVWHPFGARLREGRMELTVIDVGQGDSLLLSAPGGGAVLIDAGGFPDFSGVGRARLDIGEAVVSPYLWSRSIQRLRALAVTHGDADHAGGGAAILKNFDVGELWLPAGVVSDALEELRRIAAERGVRVRELGAGDRIRLGEASLEVLSPSSIRTVGSPNDRSLALLARFGERSFLLTGDLERLGEESLAKRLPALAGGVLKVSHHGSRSSSWPVLLARFQPTFAIVSAGRDNLYGHPHPEALERLRTFHARVLRTDRQGLVSVSTDGRRLFWTSFERERAVQASAASAFSRR